MEYWETLTHFFVLCLALPAAGGRLPRGILIAVSLVTVLVLARPSAMLAHTLDILPAAIVFLAYCSVGMLMKSQALVRQCFLAALGVGLVLNVFCALVQWQLWHNDFTAWVPTVGRHVGRSTGLVGQPNKLAFFLILALVVMQVFWSRAQSLWHGRRLIAWNVMLIGLYASTIMAIATTQSRMAWACSFLCAAAWAWQRRGRPVWLTVLLALLPAFIFGADYLRGAWIEPQTWTTAHSRLVSNEHPRLSLWTHVLQMIAQKPWLGWGWAETRYAQFESLVALPHSGVFNHTHNIFLELALSFGIPIAVLALLGLGWVVWRASPWKEKDELASMAWLALLCLLVYSMLEFPLWSLRFVAIAGILVGLVCRQAAATPAGAKPSPSVPFFSSSSGRVLLTALLWSISLLAMRDYQWASRAFGSSALWRIGPEGSLPHVMAAQQTVLFGANTGFAAVASPARKHLSDPQIVHFGEQALHFAPEPLVLKPLIEAHLRLGHNERAEHLLARARNQFPDQMK
jgi:O-antigen ligase